MEIDDVGNVTGARRMQRKRRREKKKWQRNWRADIFAFEIPKAIVSHAGTRTRVAWVKARYPNQLDYGGDVVGGVRTYLGMG